jgi:ankyrin repeat protein
VEVLISEGGADVGAVFEAEGKVHSREGAGAGLKGRTGSVSKEGRGRRGRNAVSALHLAHGSHTCTRLLLEGGAKVDMRDGSGRTPLHWAAEAGNFDVVRLLVGAGADMNVAAEDGATPLAALVEFVEDGKGKQGQVEIAKLLLPGGVGSGNCSPSEKRTSEKV